MLNIRRIFFALTVSSLIAAPMLYAGRTEAAAATSEELNTDAHNALDRLYKMNGTAAAIGKKAKAVLVFPDIVKAGLIFGGAYGEGVLLKGGAATDYYNSISGSWGLQAGAQSYGYAVFLMNDKALNYLNRSDGWEIGVGPTVVLVDEGVAKNLSSTTLQDDAYAFIFNQQGLMAGISIEGTKVSRIRK